MELEDELKQLIKGFITDMNKWEKYANEVAGQNLPLDEEDELIISALRVVFEKYCTNRANNLKQGRLNCISYGEENSFNYDPKQEIVKEVTIESNSKKAVVETYRENPLEQSKKYFLAYKKGVWLIDSRKVYSSYKEKWVNRLL